MFGRNVFVQNTLLVLPFACTAFEKQSEKHQQYFRGISSSLLANRFFGQMLGHTNNPIGSLASYARRCRISYRSSFVFVATDIHFQVNECDCFLSTCMPVVYLVESFRMASTVFRTAGIICLGLHVCFSFGSKKRCTDVGGVRGKGIR